MACNSGGICPAADEYDDERIALYERNKFELCVLNEYTVKNILYIISLKHDIVSFTSPSLLYNI